ncbi:hypothetical protein L861_23145 [Litchfieldella anticariensis FP35 = DSM 16096]|uniref:Uncharacterized protein n=1 Tax=Litchfieldella anticariensis (strain DSM 16096 / CECT 5854 / CIP 108499 / LMG 22089 / FP35) TaxID=1121939 RepID=S2KRS7_LITA3|nr:hypothetical protein L861_23145 [Halomonas anticariensis FP35 = DSM 16096]
MHHCHKLKAVLVDLLSFQERSFRSPPLDLAFLMWLGVKKSFIQQ